MTTVNAVLVRVTFLGVDSAIDIHEKIGFLNRTTNAARVSKIRTAVYEILLAQRQEGAINQEVLTLQGTDLE